MNSHHLLHSLPRLTFGIEGIQCRSRLVVSKFLDNLSHRILQEVEIGSQSRDPGKLPRPTLLCFILSPPEFYSVLGILGLHPRDDC